MPGTPCTLEVATTPSSQVSLGQVPSELQAYQLTIGARPEKNEIHLRGGCRSSGIIDLDGSVRSTESLCYNH